MDAGSLFRFRLEVGGIARAAFLEVTGLGAERVAIDFREGEGNPAQHKLPAAPTVGTITLKRGIALNSALQDWYNTWMDDEATAERQEAAIVLVDKEGADAGRWELSGARPVTWIATDLKDEGNITAIETLELTHEGLETAE
jgi:phage tail-like protein